MQLYLLLNKAQKSLKCLSDVNVYFFSYDLFQYLSIPLSTSLIIKRRTMLLLKRICLNVSTAFKPTRGKIMQGKWEKITQYLKRNDAPLKSVKNKDKVVDDAIRKVQAVEAFRTYLWENPFPRMYLQGGLDTIPEFVDFHYEDEFGVVSAKPRAGICYGYSWERLIDTFASAAVIPPKFQDVDITGVPFLCLIMDLLNTDQGRFFFSIPEVNQHLKNIFNTYAQMLDSSQSLKHMNAKEGGWLSLKAIQRVNYDEFICDQTLPHYGFKSWHDWFIREIKEEARPFNKDENQIINNTESFPYYNTPYRKVQWKDKFWLKDQRYSLCQMFDLETRGQQQQNFFKDKFIDGTVYQGFLNPWCYHKWRSPVSGTVVRCYRAGQTYYATNPNLHERLDQSYVSSQPLHSMTSARQIYVIKADNIKIGHIAIIEIGMAEVSGLENHVKVGQRVNKGDLIGHFRFGGSSHLMVFDRNAVNLRFSDTIYERKINPETRVYESTLQKVRSPLAFVG